MIVSDKASVVPVIARPYGLQVQPQPVTPSHFTDKTGNTAILYATSGQHSHQCACLCLKVAAVCQLFQTFQSASPST